MKIAIFGASGQGRETADICYDLGYSEIVFLVKSDDEKSLWDNKALIDNNENADYLQKEGFSFCIAIGDPDTRENVFKRHDKLNFPAIIHPSASFGRNQKSILENSKGAVVAAGCRFTNNISIGAFNFFNLNATISHDCKLGNFASVMSGATISGNVEVCNNAYIGAGSTIIQGTNEKKLIIGKNSIVGAGAVVTKNVPENIKVVGVPARPML